MMNLLFVNSKYISLMKVILSISLLLLFTTAVSAQLVNHVDFNRYEYKGKLYKKQELGIIYKDNSESIEVFEKANRQKRISRNLFYYGVGSFVLGNGLIFQGISDDFNVGLLVSGLLIGYTLGPTLLIVAIPFRFGSSRNYRKAIDLYNFNYIEINGYEKDQSSFDLKISGNGLGLIYSF